MAHDKGYYRQPALHGDLLIFVSETDLWRVDLGGAGPLLARRLTAHQVDASWPCLSPDGQLVAFAAQEEGATEIYVMPADGGRAERLTFQGSVGYPCGFTPDGREVVYASIAEAPFARLNRLWSVPVAGGAPRLWPIGPARRYARSAGGRTVITRREQEIARWKRYKGGTKGDLWLDDKGDGEFRELLRALEGNLGSPCFAGETLYFLADHEGYGNVYALDPGTETPRRVTDHRDYYARALASDGKRLVYQCGADLYLLDPAGGKAAAPAKLDVRINSSKPQLARRFAPPARYLQGFALHPEGHSLVVTSRGKPFAFGNWERDVLQLGQRDGVRYRLCQYMPDGKRILALSDAGGEEALELHALPAADDGVLAELPPPVRLDGLDIGHVRALTASPVGELVALSNHRCEVVLVDLEQRTAKVVDRSVHSEVSHLRFSPDGRWLAYSAQKEPAASQVFVAEVATGTVHAVTTPVGHDYSPTWGPEGKYLWLLSARTFDPVYDAVRFDLGFPRAVRPYVIPLRKDLESPFDQPPRPLEGGAPKAKKDDAKKDEAKKDDEKKDESPKPSVPEVGIDFDGIERRLVEVPGVPEARYDRLAAVKGKLFLVDAPVEGALGRGWHSEPPASKLLVYDVETQKLDVFAESVSGYALSRDGKTICFRAQSRLRVVKTAGKPDAKETKAGRASGWVDLDRIRLAVVPQAEWRQMYREMWRLQRDHFWTTDLSKVDWQEAHDRYLPILGRVATRSEFSDLAWELQGELGTSHAYESGGDVRQPPAYSVGKLGADLRWDDAAKAWSVNAVVRGDSWDRGSASPVAAPGVDLAVGDQILAVDGQRVDLQATPAMALVQKANVDVALVVRRAGDTAPRRVVVRPLWSDLNLRYRAWVEDNRERTRALSNGRLGYVHVPDMGPRGYAEFFRYYLRESYRDGLIVDVRYNGGGHVSQLLLEKLARKRLGYMVSHHLAPMARLNYSVNGPIVCVTNEHAGSDGDIFSHSFKMLRLGPLVGKRTWGGVVGIDGRNGLVDGTMVTQPEYSTWFYDVGFGIENRGTDPDVEVEIRPQDYARGEDPQLARAVALALAEMERNPPPQPDFSRRPNLARP